LNVAEQHFCIVTLAGLIPSIRMAVRLLEIGNKTQFVVVSHNI
jgi:hypothetical protein